MRCPAPNGRTHARESTQPPFHSDDGFPDPPHTASERGLTRRRSAGSQATACDTASPCGDHRHSEHRRPTRPDDWSHEPNVSAKPESQAFRWLIRVYRPCQYFGTCREAVWNPRRGHIPRGFLGATATGRERTLVGLRRTYERVTGKSLVPSSFYDRFSKELARMFRAVLRELMTKLAASEVRYGGVLEGFRDVLVADATVVKLHPRFQADFARPSSSQSSQLWNASGVP